MAPIRPADLTAGPDMDHGDVCICQWSLLIGHSQFTQQPVSLQGSLPEILAEQHWTFVSVISGRKKLSPPIWVEGWVKKYLKGKLSDNQLCVWRICLKASVHCAVSES